MSTNLDPEYSAWLWLMALPRVKIPDGTPGLKYREMSDRQIKITASPGTLNSNCGAPLVHVSVLLPDGKTRVKSSGNSLYVACERVQADAWRMGVKFDFLSTFHMKRQDSVSSCA